MSFKNIKALPFLLSLALVGTYGMSLRANAAQLNFQDSLESPVDSSFSVPYDSTLEEAGLVETAEQESDVTGFNCEVVPEDNQSESQIPAEAPLSYLGPNLIASGATSDIGQIEPITVAQLGPIIGEMCEIEGAPIGGGGPGFPFAALAPLAGLGFIPLVGGGGDGDTPPPTAPPVPEPLATPFVLATLGLAGVIARKKLRASNSDNE